MQKKSRVIVLRFLIDFEGTRARIGVAETIRTSGKQGSFSKRGHDQRGNLVADAR